MNENEQTLNEFEDISIVSDSLMNDSTIQEETSDNQPNGTPWRALSIGGTFGLLLAGGGIYASGMTKGDDEDGLLAGAQASDSVAIAGVKTPESVEPADDDPVMLDENGNEILPVSRQQAEAHLAEVEREAYTAPQHTAATQQPHHDTAHETHRTEHEASSVHDEPVIADHYQEPVEAEEPYLAQDGMMVHPVNIMTIDDHLPFDQAFAMAREQLGAGQAFIWRDGVYGTYNQDEWYALSRDEQHEFTAVAVKQFQHMDVSQNIASHHQPTHFVEGNVLGADDVVVIDDVADISTDEVSVIGDDDVMIIESNNTIADSQPEVITLDNDLDGMDQVAAMLDFDGDGSLTGDDVLGTIATLVNEGSAIIDPLFSNTGDNGATDDMPDYVSDADTLGLV